MLPTLSCSCVYPDPRAHMPGDSHAQVNAGALAAGNNSLLAQLHAERAARAAADSAAAPALQRGAAAQASAGPSGAADSAMAAQRQPISLLTYNVWFSNLGLEHRMAAIGNIIAEKGHPTIVCMQARLPRLLL